MSTYFKSALSIYLLCFCTTLPLAQNQSVQLNVLSWNIQMLPNSLAIFSKALQKKQALRAPWIIDYCSKSTYDVIVFQEVFDLDIKRKLTKGLASVYPYQQKTMTKAGRLTSNGILIVSKYPLKYVGHVIYPKGAHEDAWAAKGCTMVSIEKEGKQVQVAGTHLQAGNSDKAKVQRDIQYRAIASLLSKYKVDSIPQLVVGDMNTPKHVEHRYRTMMSVLGMQDIVVVDEKPYTIDPQNSWNKGSKSVQLDYILYNFNKAKCRMSDAEIIRPVRQHKGHLIDLADHYGISSRLNWLP